MREEEMSSRELSIERTKQAVFRTRLAASRTFNAWVRTGLASVLAGLAIVNFINSRGAVNFYVVLIGIIFVATGIMIYIFAYFNYKKNMKEIKQDDRRVILLVNFMLILVIAMTIAAVLIFGLLLYIRQSELIAIF